ncbi:MAG: Hpt domain-containing protein [Acidobacteria bacterium]|nr:Hpt domain-containing protein [Acidobacteriota bacterium]
MSEVEGAVETEVDVVRNRLRTTLREVNDLIAAVRTTGLPDGTHALASALRQRLDDLGREVDRVLNPDGTAVAKANDGSVVAPLPPVHETVLAALLNDLGDTARVAQLVQLFLNELHPRRTALIAAVDARDLQAAQAVAHTLKSSALLLGAIDLGRACEVLLQLDEEPLLKAKVEAVLQQATAVARWFQIWLSNLPAR